MLDIFDSITFGFKEILRFKNLKVALAFGITVFALWILIGIFIWDDLVGLSSSIIDLVPFSMIRADGAWMLSSLLWFSAVIITFGLFFIFFGDFILQKIAKEKYNHYLISVISASVLLWSFIWFFNADAIHVKLIELITWLPFQTVEATMANIFSFYIIYNAIILTLMFVASLYSKVFLRKISDEEFPSDVTADANEIKTIRFTIKDSAIYIIATLVLFPLAFIPFLNIFLQILLWMWLTKDTLVYDSAVLLVEESDIEKLKKHRNGFYFISFIVALFNFLPFFNIFGSFFGELAMFQYVKTIKSNF